MLSAIHSVFFFGLACYLLGALAAVRYLSAGGLWPIFLARAASGLGAAALLTVLVLRGSLYHRVPLTTPIDSIGLLILCATLIVLAESARRHTEGLLCFFLPLGALIYLAAAVFGYTLLTAEPRSLKGLPLTLHVGLAIFAYALFFTASLTSLAYIAQSANLKRRRTTGLFHRLPSLEQLDRSLHRLILAGYPIFLVTLGVGMMWAHREPGLLSAAWFWSPKVQMAYVMAIFYAVCVHGRQLGWFRGLKLAQLVSGGFLTLLLAYLAMALLSLRDVNFWGTQV